MTTTTMTTTIEKEEKKTMDIIDDDEGRGGGMESKKEVLERRARRAGYKGDTWVAFDEKEGGNDDGKETIIASSVVSKMAVLRDVMRQYVTCPKGLIIIRVRHVAEEDDKESIA